jgi:hypothetical protein
MFDLNDSTTWGHQSVHSLPRFDVAGFQAKINKIFPVEDYPNVRLVWAASIKDCYSRRYSEWSKISGLGTESELRARYRFAELKIDGVTIDIPPPRWIIEERNSLGQVGPSWEAARFGKDGREMFPPLPLEGYYSELFKVVEHNGECCKSTPKEIVCWGQYREPNQSDLDRLQKAKFLREQAEKIDLNAPLNDKVLASAGRETNARIAQKQLMNDEKMKEFVDENALELIAMFTGQPLSAKTKKFSIGQTKKENGLILPA